MHTTTHINEVIKHLNCIRDNMQGQDQMEANEWVFYEAVRHELLKFIAAYEQNKGVIIGTGS